MEPWSLGDGSIPLANLSHVGIAVKNAEQTCRFLSSIWSIGDPEVFDYEPKAEDLISGEPFAVRLVFVKFGPVPIELLQPLDDRSIWAKFIKEKGEGKVFSSPMESLAALAHGKITTHARIKVRLGSDRIVCTGRGQLSKPKNGIIETTAGRVIFNSMVFGSWQSRQPTGCVIWPLNESNVCL